MKHHHVIAWMFFLALVCALARPARADEGDGERAKKLFNEANTLIDQGNFALACAKLEESERLDAALGTQFNLALCYEKIGKLASAWRNYGAVERVAHAAGKAVREQAAHDKLAALRSHVPHLVIAVHGVDVAIKVDGALVDPATFSFYPLDAGIHVVDATAPGRSPWTSNVTVPETVGDARAADVAVNVPELAQGVGRVQQQAQAVAPTGLPERLPFQRGMLPPDGYRYESHLRHGWWITGVSLMVTAIVLDVAMLSIQNGKPQDNAIAATVGTVIAFGAGIPMLIIGVVPVREFVRNDVVGIVRPTTPQRTDVQGAMLSARFSF